MGVYTHEFGDCGPLQQTDGEDALKLVYNQGTLHEWVATACAILNSPAVKNVYPELTVVGVPTEKPYIFLHKNDDVEDLYGNHELD